MEQNHILLFQFHVVVFLFLSNNNPLNSHCEEKNAIQIHKQAMPWIMLFYFNITTKNYDAIIIANKISVEDFISDAGKNLELTNTEMIKKKMPNIVREFQFMHIVFYLNFIN